MSFSPRPCGHCGGLSFHVIPGVQLEVWRASTVFGMASSQQISGGAFRWTFTVVACTQCGRTETFTSNAPDMAKHYPGSYVTSGAAR